jgi:hypothetical protein
MDSHDKEIRLNIDGSRNKTNVIILAKKRKRKNII